ncbi:MAG: SRPBCC domain-containing protein [Pseudomonadota bacterium]
MDVYHDTVRLRKCFQYSAEQLFAAYLDPALRQEWAAPNDDSAVEIVHSNVRTGGTEETRCGTKGDLKYRTKVNYHLVQANQLITFTESLFKKDSILSVAAITFEFRRLDEGAELILTDQITSFVGKDMIDGHRQGFTAALVNLEKQLVSTIAK